MIHYWGNVAEGIFWILLAGIVCWRSTVSNRGAVGKTGTVAAFALFWFGISDFVEVTTGAWWRPVWLLLWKAACVMALLHCLLCYFKAKSGLGESESEQAEPPS